MLPPEPRRSARVVAFSVAALAAGALIATVAAPRVAHAQAPSSTVVVPEEGLTVRSADGRTIRLFYDARRGAFEVVGAPRALGRRFQLERDNPWLCSSSTAASWESLREDPIRLRVPETPPKVQLERNNPWPASSASAASCEHLVEEPIPLRVPRTPPKVQLERDDPWPSSSSTAASCENLRRDPIRLRAPQTPPKVQLERDNPWP
jgi:hypothetical protein